MELKSWLEEQLPHLVHRWEAEITSRGNQEPGEWDNLLPSFLHHLVSFLPPCLGPDRERAELVWQQAAHLYGSLAVRRGLAAGEVVEELQLLREVILRLLLARLPQEAGNALPTRELLSLNRVLDRGVSRASIAYVDDLFFAHLQGSGVPESLTPDLAEEIRTQLAALRRELEGAGGGGGS